MQVISEYRKAKGIMADVAAKGPTEGVWHNLFLEVDKVEFTAPGMLHSVAFTNSTVRFHAVAEVAAAILLVPNTISADAFHQYCSASYMHDSFNS